MWFLMFSLLSSIIISQISAPLSFPESIGPTFSHTGATATSRADSCQVCHANGLDLALATNQICFDCHKAVETKAAKHYQHPEIPNEKYISLNCEGCHKLHKASASQLLTQNETELCYSCHPETREHKSHPVLKFDKGFGPEPIIGPDGKVIDCASHCHDTHGTDYKYLCSKEPGRELCISCHKEFQ
jgi:predicted CXXCH cytochrome family protein